MMKSFLVLIVLSVLFGSVVLYSFFPDYTLVIEMEVIGRAHSVQAQRNRSGTLEEPQKIARYLQIRGIPSPQPEWRLQLRYPVRESYQTHVAEFALSADLTSDSYSSSWTSPTLRIDTPGSYNASICVAFHNIKRGEYSLNITLFLGEDIEDTLAERIIIP